jgi:hypothetical protein
MSLFCRTNVSVKDEAGNHVRFKGCGKPVMSYVLVGHIECGYCLEHAMAAQEYVAKQGQKAIGEIQKRQGVA